MLSSSGEVTEKYARAIFDLAIEEDSLDKVKSDLYFITDVFSKNEQIKAFLNNPFKDKKIRKEVIVNIFSGNIDPISLNFLLVVIEKKIEELLPLIVKNFNTLLYEKNGIVEVRVTTARELSADESDKMTKRLSEMLKKPVVLDKKIDPSIIGGAIIQVGDRLINGSIIRKLREYEQLVYRVNDGERGAIV